MITLSSLRGTAALGGALLSLGLTGAAFAQAPAAPAQKADMAECQRLYGQWSRYNGTSAYGRMITADAAFEECRKGNVQAGVADLRRVLERSNIPLPPSETATAR